AIELFGTGVGERLVDTEPLRFLGVLRGLDLAQLRREKHGRRAGLLERRARRGELVGLHAVHREDRHLRSFKGSVLHPAPPAIDAAAMVPRSVFGASPRA